jgi:hypothetical protein
MPTTDHEVQVTYQAVPYLLYAPVAFAGAETLAGQPVGRLSR